MSVLTARDLMTKELVTVPPDTPVIAMARILAERGLISRADLLHGLLLPPEKVEGVPDERIRNALIAAMRNEPWAETYHIMVDVKDGAVTCHGFSRSDAIKRGLRVLVESVPGVTSVTDETQPLPMYLYAAY